MKTKILPLFLFFILLASACEALPGSSEDTALQASGMIETTKVTIASELPGRILDIAVMEGDAVKAGDILFRLDNTLLKSQQAAAKAGLNTIQKGVASAQITLDTAQLQYQSTLDTALAATQPNRIANWQDAKPPEFDLPLWYYTENERYRSSMAEADAAKAALDSALRNLASIEKKVGSTQFVKAEERLSNARLAFQQARDLLDQTSTGEGIQALRDAAQDTYDDALSELNKAQEAYADAMVSGGAEDLLTARAKAIFAQERYDQALDAVRAMQTGARSPEVQLAAKTVEQAEAALEQAQAAVEQAKAELELIDAQLAKVVVTSPVDGVVLTSSIQPGEVLQVGMAAMTIGTLDYLKVTVYIPEDRYGEIRLGNTASLRVDSFPGTTFPAKVTRIADQAEFTPRNVQTKEERQTTVYAVDLTVENDSGKLKPGMPVDVTFANQ